MPSIRSLVHRGRPFTGRDLQRALLAAARPAVGGGGILATTRESESVVRKTGRTPIPRLATLTIQIRPNPTSILTDNNGNPARWLYGWDEVLEIAPNTWQLKPEGRSSDDPNRQPVRNWAEQMNTPALVARGIPVTQEEITVQVIPIPGGQVIPAQEYQHDGGGFGYWFEAYNGLLVECVTPAAGAAMAPPTAIRKYLSRNRPDGKMPPGQGWKAYASAP